MYCIAGKNQCSIDALKYLLERPDVKNDSICVCPNNDDNGVDTWQPSLLKFANDNNIQLKQLKQLYSISDLKFFSLEYDRIIDTNNFKSGKLFNFHFSLLPKYRGCHTNYLQIKNGEKFTGVTCHEIDNGIDSGKIIDQIQYNLKKNDTAKENYLKLMSTSVRLFMKLFDLLSKGNYSTEKQVEKNSTYYARTEINYKLIEINFNTTLLDIHNQIRALIFPPYQFSIANCMITNFHTPKSTLMMMVSAFAGTDFIKYAYKTAIKEKYNFYSYGDAMFII